ncbi:MAG: metallophosphoesterase [Arenicellales bacterium]|nr:metallophosphoesterase [Arenicellales bacterium]
MNLIGDIQGNYHTLRGLLKQMPDEEPVSVGDMVDRGPRSREVLEFFRLNGKALLGNHEHMMRDYFKGSGIYEPNLWFLNSGDATLYSLGLERSGSLPEILLDYLESLPLLLRDEGLIVTHAPIHRCWSIEDIASSDHLERSPLEQSVIWNREDPVPLQGFFQIFGHNGYRYARAHFFDTGVITRAESAHAVCIDTVRGQVLSGMHWPSRQIYTQEYID